MPSSANSQTILVTTKLTMSTSGHQSGANKPVPSFIIHSLFQADGAGRQVIGLQTGARSLTAGGHLGQGLDCVGGRKGEVNQQVCDTLTIVLRKASNI